MAQHNNTGRLGEQLAAELLLNKGYKILEKNWRWGKGEIDLICTYQDSLIFVEVKTRSVSTFGHPEDAVSANKQQRMFELAAEYMFRIQYEEEYRFDIISIVLQPKLDIKHYQDAFFPHW